MKRTASQAEIEEPASKHTNTMASVSSNHARISSSVAARLGLRYPASSMKAAIAKIKSTREVVLRIESLYNRGGTKIKRQFIHISDLQKFIDYVDWPSKIPMAKYLSIHEMIPTASPVKPWFDFDDFPQTPEQFMTLIDSMFPTFMLIMYEATIREEDMTWCQTSSADKKSLHLTIDCEIYIKNNIAMGELAKHFIDWCEKPSVSDHIDLSVYSRNSSIRVCDSSKIGEPGRVMELVHGSHHPIDMYVTYFSDIKNCTEIKVRRSRSEVVDSKSNTGICANILKEALKMISCTIKTIKKLDIGTQVFSCVIEGRKRCRIGKCQHSKDEDIFFIIDLDLPYVVQKCHSKTCTGKQPVRLSHTQGNFGPMARSTTPCPYLVIEYTKNAKELEDQELENRQMNTVYEFYYNRFFCCIVAEREFMIGVEYTDDETKRLRKYVTKPMEFVRQYAPLPGIKNWHESITRRQKQHIGFFPWDKSMLSVSHTSPECSIDTHFNEIKSGPKFNKSFFNKFCGLGVTHEAAMNWEYDRDAVRPFIEHIIKVWAGGDEELSIWILQWFAASYQHPWKKNSTCIVLQGSKGCGKGIIMSLIEPIIGEDHFWQIGNLNSLTGTYTSPKFRQSLIGFVDEAFWGGDPKSANALKGIITEKNQESNVKYQAQVNFESYMNVVIASNNDRIIEYTPDNRRYQFINIKDTTFATIDEKNAYFSRLAAVPPIAIAAFLLRRVCLCAFDDKKIIKTKGASAQLIESLSPVQQWWYDALCEGGKEDGDADGEAEVDMDEHDLFQDKKTPIRFLHTLMIDHAKTNGCRYTDAKNAKSFVNQLRKMCPSIPKSCRMYTGPMKQVRALRLPSIEICRKEFEEFTKHSMDFEI